MSYHDNHVTIKWSWNFRPIPTDKDGIVVSIVYYITVLFTQDFLPWGLFLLMTRIIDFFTAALLNVAIIWSGHYCPSMSDAEYSRMVMTKNIVSRPTDVGHARMAYYVLLSRCRHTGVLAGTYAGIQTVYRHITSLYVRPIYVPA